MANSESFAHTQNRLLTRLAEYGLSKQVIADLAGRCTTARYPKGSPLFLKGSPADFLFAVTSGIVKIYCPCAEGRRILVDLAGPGDLVGYADFLDDNNQRWQIFEAQALTNCSVALFTRQHVHRVLKDLDAPSMLHIGEQLNSFWSAAANRYATFLSMSLRERLELVLRELAARFGVADSRGVLLAPQLAQDDLAEMVGSSRPMVSKLLAEMVQRGALLRQGRRCILLRGAGSAPPASQRPPTRLARSGGGVPARPTRSSGASIVAPSAA